MRILLILIAVILSLCANAKKSKKNIVWEKFTQEEIAELHQRLELYSRRKDFSLLLKAKNYLLNGEIKKTLFFLNKINDDNAHLKYIKFRYKAIAYFIMGNYQDSLSILEDSSFNKLSYYPKICLLKVLNLIFLNKSQQLNQEYEQCYSSSVRFSPNDHLWTDSMVKLRSKNKSALSGQDILNLEYILDNNDLIRPWLKIGIYSNKELLLSKSLNKISSQSYQSHSIRELIGLVHYRLGNNELALKFIEDINSPNAENIKGNINLRKKQYELAFAHFKLALQSKENSINALERAIPLSWTLEQWEDGLSLLSKLIDDENDIKKKLALNTMFQIRLGNFKRSMNQLNILNSLYQQNLPKELSIMKSYVSTILNNTTELKKYSYRSCLKGDGFNCWLSIQQYIWDDITKTIQRETKTYSDQSLNLEILKSKSEIKGISEQIIVDQRDIEELDSDQVDLREY